jgi:hypothetical protein
MSFIFQWLSSYFTIPENREDGDRKYRQQVASEIQTFLYKLKNQGVHTRKDLYHYVGYFVYGTKIVSQENSRIREILVRVGWMPLDPFFDNDETRLNAKMIFTNESINQAIEQLKIPYNIHWCNCLAEDYSNHPS